MQTFLAQQMGGYFANPRQSPTSRIDPLPPHTRARSTRQMNGGSKYLIDKSEMASKAAALLCSATKHCMTSVNTELRSSWFRWKSNAQMTDALAGFAVWFEGVCVLSPLQYSNYSLQDHAIGEPREGNSPSLHAQHTRKNPL